MVDAESDKYRPRRAFVEPDPAPTAPVPPPVPDPADEDAPKPLYRDEVAGDATTVRPPAADFPAPAAGTTAPAAGETTVRPITFTPRRTRSNDEDATTILPRADSRRRGAEAEALDDLDDDESSPWGQRTKLAVWIGAAVAVTVVGLAIGWAVFGVGNTPTTGTTPVPSIGASTDPSAPTPQPSVELLGDGSLAGTADAALVAKKSWKVASTERELTEDSPLPACFGTEPVEGQPIPQQRVLRLLSSSGKDAPGLLHEATSYATPEEAAQAYAVAAKTLGGCEVSGSYLFSGQTVSGVGDQSAGVIVTSVTSGQTSHHSLVLSRTGRVLNIVDATRPDDKLAPLGVAQATAAIVNRQCAAAGGACGGSVRVQDGPPPLGGDEPGFLAAGDLPPAGKTPMPWVATPPEAPKAGFEGSGCEAVDWSTLSADETTSRVYIVADSGNYFGLNDIIVTMEDEDAAKKLVSKIKSDWESCEKRKLTPKVAEPKEVSARGARKTEVSGFTTEIRQRSVDGTKQYRVGIVSAGDKVAFTFLNPQDGFDLNPEQWNTVAVRAGQRATQVN